MTTPEPNYVLTVTTNCGACHTNTPVIFDTGLPLSQVAFPYRATMPFDCSGCGATGEVSIALMSIPGGLPGKN